MRKTRLLALSALACLSLAGCLTHIAADVNPRHLHVHWVEDFDTARLIAAQSGRPILLVMVAGEIRERC